MTDREHEHATGAEARWGWPVQLTADDPAAATGRPAGWRPDPWVNGQYRWWDGANWTGHVFPATVGGAPAAPGAADGTGAPAGTARAPTAAPTAPPASVPAGPPVGPPAPPAMSHTPAVTPPPPQWLPPSPPQAPPPPPVPPAIAQLPPRRSRALVAVPVAVLIALLAFAGIVFALRRRAEPPTPAALPVLPQQPTSPSPPGSGPRTRPPRTSDPSSSLLAGLVVSPADVPAGVSVLSLPGGDDLSIPTLDLCNGTFPSEALRTDRLQVTAFDPAGDAAISTEAVLYRNAAATAQAFAELKKVAAACPATPVDSPVGERTVATRFNPAPDGAWPQAPGVERLAFDLTTTDLSGDTRHTIAVYLRRGRVLVGVYFSPPEGSHPPVQGQSSLPGIVNVFASRLAQLPASAVNGG